MQELQRPERIRRIRRRVGIAVGVVAGVFVSGALVGSATVETCAVAMIPVPIAPPTIVQAAPTVTVKLPEPEPLPAAVPLRAIAPTLPAAACLFEAEDPHCEWDDGFPAISADGSSIVVKFVPEGRGGLGLGIRFVDPRTSRITRSVVILDPNESEHDEAGRAKLQLQVAKRMAAVQRTLDAGKYRALTRLGSSLDDVPHDEKPTKIYAEVDDGATRIIDPATSTVVFQHRFAVPNPRTKPVGDDEMCGAWNLRHTTVWWDPTTKYVLASHLYHTGGCMCDSPVIEQVARAR